MSFLIRAPLSQMMHFINNGTIVIYGLNVLMPELWSLQNLSADSLPLEL